MSKVALLLITFFLGGLGIHKFYLAKPVQGTFYLLFFWTGIPGLIALVEFVIYVFTSEDKLSEKYASTGSLIVTLSVAFLAFVIIAGILAAIALPAYQDYTVRARLSEGLLNGSSLRAAISESYSKSGPSDMTCTAERCPLGHKFLITSPNVSRIESDRSGAITIEFSEKVLKAPGNKMVLSPLIDSRPADLSKPTTGASLTWSCGGPETTVAAKYRPMSCRN